MVTKIFNVFILSTLFLNACGADNQQETSTENGATLQQSEDVIGSEVTEPTAEEIYSDFELYDREEGSKGTQENPYNVGEKAIAKVGYWDLDLKPHEAMIEIEIDTLITGDEAEDPENEAPDKTQRVLVLTNVKMIEGPEDVPYSISIQPLVYNDDFFIGQDVGQNSAFVFETPITLGESQVGTISILAPEGDLNGESFVLNTGLDQVWFNF